ncbi:putative SprT family Zn-dependent metalloprotease [Arcanobacterium wilhelmae]|uniref:SprT family Zn-dependent metalloprotease n=1 Tax=Arcanobacterium wilhelmae TaxID=1803177 RepID=A0ABT9NBC9_9ACTO|nr:SprT-like domain-containing protein [Arcanobacterium wilhelmae]MDP9801012.1 putative SprT family Zn-dependent metalloprotease [Arcanobacterium wilhelmae]WFN90372.1 SprT-like domain-containing protein [Arcanobacterium wilhelmae]
MDISDALELARELMDEHGVGDWEFAFDRAKRRAGATNFTARKITLSKALVQLYAPEQVRAVMLHEIAHALVGPRHGHDAEWKRMCVAIGGDGRARLPMDSPEPEAPWVGRCPAGHTAQRYRRPTRQLSCRRCSRSFSPEHLFVWVNRETGERTAPA